MFDVYPHIVARRLNGMSAEDELEEDIQDAGEEDSDVKDE